MISAPDNAGRFTLGILAAGAVKVLQPYYGFERDD